MLPKNSEVETEINQFGLQNNPINDSNDYLDSSSIYKMQYSLI